MKENERRIITQLKKKTLLQSIELSELNLQERRIQSKKLNLLQEIELLESQKDKNKKIIGELKDKKIEFEKINEEINSKQKEIEEASEKIFQLRKKDVLNTSDSFVNTLNTMMNIYGKGSSIEIYPPSEEIDFNWNSPSSFLKSCSCCGRAYVPNKLTDKGICARCEDKK